MFSKKKIKINGLGIIIVYLNEQILNEKFQIKTKNVKNETKYVKT